MILFDIFYRCFAFESNSLKELCITCKGVIYTVFEYDMKYVLVIINRID